MPTERRWKVVFYTEADGSQPVFDYIFSGGLNETDQAVLFQVLTSLQNQGPEIQGTNMDKHIDGPIRELRKDRHRILYAQWGHEYVLLAAFLKRTQKTPPEQIDLAWRRYRQYTRDNPEMR